MKFGIRSPQKVYFENFHPKLPFPGHGQNYFFLLLHLKFNLKDEENIPAVSMGSKKAAKKKNPGLEVIEAAKDLFLQQDDPDKSFGTYVGVQLGKIRDPVIKLNVKTKIQEMVTRNLISQIGKTTKPSR